MVASWLRVAARGSRRLLCLGALLQDAMKGSKESSSGLCLPGDGPRSVACTGPVGGRRLGVGHRLGLEWALGWCLPGRCIPRWARVAAVCWGRGWSGAWVTRGLCPVGGRWGGGWRHARHPVSVPQVPYRVDQCLVPRCFRVPPCPAGDWLACRHAGCPACPSDR